MTDAPSPEQVVRAVMDGIARGAWGELHQWYAEDAVVEHRFALPAPTRLEGREAIRVYFERSARAPLTLAVRNMTVHQTADPEVVIAEWDYEVTAPGQSAEVANIQVSRVRDGLIVASRDYHNHFALAEAVGAAPRLLAAMGYPVRE